MTPCAGTGPRRGSPGTPPRALHMKELSDTEILLPSELRQARILVEGALATIEATSMAASVLTRASAILQKAAVDAEAYFSEVRTRRDKARAASMFRHTTPRFLRKR